MVEPSLPFAVPDVGEAEMCAVREALRTGWLSGGPLVREFERRFADHCAPGRHAVAVNSATAGLHLGLEALGVGRGTEVLVPTWTFTATAAVVAHLGAVPVFVDSDPATLNIDLSEAGRLVTDRVAAIIPVHFAGHPVAYHQLDAFAERHGLAVVEDAAHAFSARSDGIPIGAGASAATVFSFYATKTMTTGDGGMLLTRDADVASRARTMRLHGIDVDAYDRSASSHPSWQYRVIALGYKYNLTDVAAAMGLVQLSRAEDMRDRRTAIAHRYLESFEDLPLDLPVRPAPNDTSAWHLFVVRLRPDAPVRRDGFIEEMSQLGVKCGVHFIPLHRQPYWRDIYQLTDEMFPVATQEFERVVSLPLFSKMTDNDVQRVIHAVYKVLR